MPPAAIVAAIRLRTNLLSYAEVAQRLNALGLIDHHLTAAECKHLIASAFRSPQDQTYAQPSW